MNIENLSLAEIVIAKPSAAALFENLQLDYCCKGKQKLNEVLSNDQVKLVTVIDLVEKLFIEDNSSSINFYSYNLTELIDFIEKHHHRYVKESMPLILQHLRKVISKHGDSYPYMIKVEEIFREVCMNFAQHMMKEELILFPKIKRIESGSENLVAIKTIINAMEMEHLDAGKMMEEIRNLCNNYNAPENACVTFRLCLDELKLFEEDLHKHVHLENNILFQKVLNFKGDENSLSCSCSI